MKYVSDDPAKLIWSVINGCAQFFCRACSITKSPSMFFQSKRIEENKVINRDACDNSGEKQYA